VAQAHFPQESLVFPNKIGFNRPDTAKTQDSLVFLNPAGSSLKSFNTEASHVVETQGQCKNSKVILLEFSGAPITKS